LICGEMAIFQAVHRGFWLVENWPRVARSGHGRPR
jgi:hypothetical protein